MPNTKSAQKALRQNIRRRQANMARKRVVKNTIKDYVKTVTSGKTEEGTQKLSSVYKKLDKAVKKNVIKKNRAARLKSRLAKKLSVGAEK